MSAKVKIFKIRMDFHNANKTTIRQQIFVYTPIKIAVRYLAVRGPMSVIGIRKSTVLYYQLPTCYWHLTYTTMPLPAIIRHCGLWSDFVSKGTCLLGLYIWDETTILCCCIFTVNTAMQVCFWMDFRMHNVQVQLLV